MSHEPFIYEGDCEGLLKNIPINSIHVTFLDPPFNQGKEYENHDDKSSVVMYWAWMKNICTLLSDVTVDGGALYFMQREKNIKKILETVSESGWIAQNIIVWKKKTSAVPQANRFSKQYQIIVFATKGENPSCSITFASISRSLKDKKYHERMVFLSLMFGMISWK